MVDSPGRPRSRSTFRAPPYSSSEDERELSRLSPPRAVALRTPTRSQHDLQPTRVDHASTLAVATGTFRAPDEPPPRDFVMDSSEILGSTPRSGRLSLSSLRPHAIPDIMITTTKNTRTIDSIHRQFYVCVHAKSHTGAWEWFLTREVGCDSRRRQGICPCPGSRWPST